MFTDRLELDENGVYRWYYDTKYGQDNTVVKIAALIGGIVALPGIFLPLLKPDVKINFWVSCAISLGLWLFVVLLTWGVNALMYKARGGTYRICYTMDRYELTVFYDERSSKSLKAMGGVVFAAGILSGNVGSALTGAGMTGAGQQAVFPLNKARTMTLYPDKDLIFLRRWLSICQVYVAPEDYETVKDHIVTYTNHHVRVIRK